MLKAFFAGAAALTAIAATPASAAQYSFTYGCRGVSGQTGCSDTQIAQGIITTDDDPSATTGDVGSYNVVSVTGTRLGQPITGFKDYLDVYQGDQALYPDRPAGYVDYNGLTYEVGGTSYNILSSSSRNPGGSDGTYTEYAYNTGDPEQETNLYINYFTLTPYTAPVPESATWAMMLAGFGAIGIALRRRVRTMVTYA